MRITTYKIELVKEESTNYKIETSDITVENPDVIGKMLIDLYRINHQTEEVVYLICLNTKNRIIGIHEVSRGILNASLIHPREIFKRAIVNNANSIIIAHNHPSGDTQPSKEDCKMYEKIKKCGEILGIELLDSIIIGNENSNEQKLYNRIFSIRRNR